MFFFGFQEPVTPIMEGIIDLHNYIFIFLIGIFVFVLLAFFYILIYYYIIPTNLYEIDQTQDEAIFEESEKQLNNILNSVAKKPNLNEIILIFKLFFQNIELFTSNLFIRTRNKLFLKYIIKEDDIKLDEIYDFYKRFSLYSLQYEILETRKIVHGTLIEIIWTIIPSIILLFIAIPSFSLLYSMDEIITPKMTIKAIGSQWFWSYEYTEVLRGFDELVDWDQYDPTNIYSIFDPKSAYYIHFLYNFDSVIIPDDLLNEGDHRLLEVDNAVILPTKTHIRLLVTANDVLHSWAVPSLGIKIDAVPGRLSQVNLFVKHEGVFYGQCSELCGVNHGFMPIVIKAINPKKYHHWLFARYVV